jgi:hypothetical protein
MIRKTLEYREGTDWRVLETSSSDGVFLYFYVDHKDRSRRLAEKAGAQPVVSVGSLVSHRFSARLGAGSFNTSMQSQYSYDRRSEL